MLLPTTLPIDRNRCMEFNEKRLILCRIFPSFFFFTSISFWHGSFIAKIRQVISLQREKKEEKNHQMAPIQIGIFDEWISNKSERFSFHSIQIATIKAMHQSSTSITRPQVNFPQSGCRIYRAHGRSSNKNQRSTRQYLRCIQLQIESIHSLISNCLQISYGVNVQGKWLIIFQVLFAIPDRLCITYLNLRIKWLISNCIRKSANWSVNQLIHLKFAVRDMILIEYQYWIVIGIIW